MVGEALAHQPRLRVPLAERREGLITVDIYIYIYI